MLLAILIFGTFGTAPALIAQATPAPDGGLALYQQLKAFELSGGSASVQNLAIQRDRVQMTFDGQFFFQAPVNGKVYGAVFIGRGVLRAEPQNQDFEKEHVRRILKSDVVDTDFRTAVLRFSDGTFDEIGKGAAAGAAASGAQSVANEFEPRLLKETGINISSRLALSILNGENPGFFVMQFDGGKRGRGTFILDPQGRLPVSAFDLNGGEKGLIFTRRDLYGNDIWTAFFSLADWQRGTVEYSDVHDLVNVGHYSMDVDVRDPKSVLKLRARMDCESLAAGLRAVTFAVNESLGEYDNVRKKKALRLKAAKWNDGSPVQAVQEEWEGALTVFLPAPQARGAKFSLDLELEGDFLFDDGIVPDVYYPRATSDWYPRHGYLRRSTFDISFLHRKKYKVASVGVRVKEEPSGKDDVVTQWKMDHPVALVTFGVGKFERHNEKVKIGETTLPLEFNSLPSYAMAIKEDFILAELSNCVQYFSAIFGAYPYSQFAALYHPRGFGQGFASMLLMPPTDRASKYTYAFVAHETAHQWWGNIVGWRSYRDQWLSEGFAEYSGILYTGLRDKPEARKELVRELRDSLRVPPVSDVGVGKGRLADIGPLILGHRLSSSTSMNAYSTLVYNKGALVLRMMHFLFMDPATGDSKLFFDMMRDFVARHKNDWATSDTFREVANEHFVKTPIAKKFGMKDLNWFFGQWVYESHLPSYRLVYNFEKDGDGSVVLKGVVHQENAGEQWFMALPLVLKLGKDKEARTVVHAYGPQTPLALKLPAMPTGVELDPDLWVLSEKTSTSKGK